MLHRAQAAYEALGSGLFRSLVGVQLGEALMLANKPEEARDAVDQALALARRRAEQGHEAYGLRLLGDIASHPDLFRRRSRAGSLRQGARAGGHVRHGARLPRIAISGSGGSIRATATSKRLSA